jgi:hypothetical protein
VNNEPKETAMKVSDVTIGGRVAYNGGSSHAKGIKKGDAGEVVRFNKRKAVVLVKYDKGTMKWIKAEFVDAARGKAAASDGKPQRVFTKEAAAPRGSATSVDREAAQLRMTEDPIRAAKEALETATTVVPSEPQQVKVTESPAAILAMFKALLDLPASADALGGEPRRSAWKKLVEAQVHHGQYARQLR